uniref:COesterase domain-containing protein n=1 Tax=Strongyloides venezuelensis TaxID=75913 RepID=A0A0K0FGP7_STRVS
MSFLDHQMVMKMVYENIGKFGGKKNMITLFEESAGRASVTAPLFSEGSYNYFRASAKLHNNMIATSKDAFAPINEDRVFFKGSVKGKFKKTDVKNDVDLLYGRNADEGTYFTIKHLSKLLCAFDPKNIPNLLITNVHLVNLLSKVLSKWQELYLNLMKKKQVNYLQYTMQSTQLGQDEK